MNPQELHVVFGTGPLGMAVMRELLSRGKRVRMVNRSGAADAPAAVELVRGDAYSVDSTRDVARGAAVVYQCAQPAYHEWMTKFPPLQAAILEGAASAGAKLVIGENLYMYGEVDGPLTENLPYAATTRKGRTRAAMAEAALAAHRGGKLRVAIGRSSDFYGPGVLDSALGDRVFEPMLRGKAAQMVGRLDVPHTYTYIEDFGKALVVLGQRDEALGQAWHVPSAATLTQRQLATIAFEEAGLSPSLSRVNRLMMAMAGIFISGARETLEMMYEFERPFVMESGKYVRAFGDHATPHREALRRTLDWYREHLSVSERAARKPVRRGAHS